MEKHWVEELFPPHFTYTLDKSPERSTPDPKDSEDDGFQRIQKLYDTVRIDLNRKEKEGQEKCIQVGEPLAEHLSQKSPSDGPAVDRRRTPSKKRGGDECIWTAKELEILRKATEEAKGENIRLSAELLILTKQNEKLARKCRRQVAALAAKDAEIHEKAQEAGRLSRSCHHLQTESQHAQVAVRLLEEDVGDLQESKRKLRRQLKSTQQELGDEKLLREKLERELQQRGKQNALESIVREDGIRLDYERQINSLYEELEGVRAELEKEKKENVTVRKALDHLRIHFANFPSKDVSSRSPTDSSGLGKLDLY